MKILTKEFEGTEWGPAALADHLELQKTLEAIGDSSENLVVGKKAPRVPMW